MFVDDLLAQKEHNLYIPKDYMLFFLTNSVLQNLPGTVFYMKV